MPSYSQNLAALLADHPDATPEQVAELSKAAQTLASFNAAPPKPKLAAVPDPAAVARARYEALQAQPLPAGASDTARVERATECAQLLKVVTGAVDSDVNANGGMFNFNFQRPEPPEAA